MTFAAQVQQVIKSHKVGGALEDSALSMQRHQVDGGCRWLTSSIMLAIILLLCIRHWYAPSFIYNGVWTVVVMQLVAINYHHKSSIFSPLLVLVGVSRGRG